MSDIREPGRDQELLSGDAEQFSAQVEPLRRELQVHCYRMLGSLQDAEDLVQETFLRAWRKRETYAGRASVRAWLYGIATNACLDELRKRSSRRLPFPESQPSDPGVFPQQPAEDVLWLEPLPDEWLAGASQGPGSVVRAREKTSLAWLAALQTLSPRQRAALILCEVLDWKIREAAELLDTSETAVHSALYRARSALRSAYPDGMPEAMPVRADDERVNELLAQYARAWESSDVHQIARLLAEDAAFAMPPFAAWFQGREAVAAFIGNFLLPDGSGGSWRLQPVEANGQPAFGFYRLDAGEQTWQAFGIHVLELKGRRIARLTHFLQPGLFRYFGLPERLLKK